MSVGDGGTEAEFGNKTGTDDQFFDSFPTIAISVEGKPDGVELNVC